QAWLRHQGVTRLEIEAVIKGYLFYPLDDPPPAPRNVNPNHLRGQWLRGGQLDLIARAGSRWQALSKRGWLAPALASTEETLEFDALQAWVETNQPLDRALLIVALEADGDH